MRNLSGESAQSPSRFAAGAQATTLYDLSMATTPILWFLTLVFLSNAPSNTLQQELGSVMRWCYDSAGNYTPNTPYQANLLTTLLPSLASNAPLNTTGYYSTAVGRHPDRVFGFAQCMSAASMQDCRTCLNQSIAAIAQLCPRRKQAFIRYENCLLRYSNQSFVMDGLYPEDGLTAPPPPPHSPPPPSNDASPPPPPPSAEQGLLGFLLDTIFGSNYCSYNNGHRCRKW